MPMNQKPPCSSPPWRLRSILAGGALQVVHRDFFRKNGGRIIPSKSLEDVFKSLKEDRSIEARWVAGEDTVMSQDHKAKTEFEQKALKALAGGESEYESAEKGGLPLCGVDHPEKRMPEVPCP